MYGLLLPCVARDADLCTFDWIRLEAWQQVIYAPEAGQKCQHVTARCVSAQNLLVCQKTFLAGSVQMLKKSLWLNSMVYFCVDLAM